MIQHDHRTAVPGCFRCELSADALILGPPQKRTLSAKDRAARTIPAGVVERFRSKQKEQEERSDDPA